MRAAGLEIIGEPILQSEAVLIRRTAAPEDTAVGHVVRAFTMYAAMACLAGERRDGSLKRAVEDVKKAVSDPSVQEPAMHPKPQKPVVDPKPQKPVPVPDL